MNCKCSGPYTSLRQAYHVRHKALSYRRDRARCGCMSPYPYPVSLPSGTGKLGVGGHALVSGAQKIGISNRKLVCAIQCTVWSQCTPVPDRRTDRQTNIMAIARRFVLTNASGAKNYWHLIVAGSRPNRSKLLKLCHLQFYDLMYFMRMIGNYTNTKYIELMCVYVCVRVCSFSVSYGSLWSDLKINKTINWTAQTSASHTIKSSKTLIWDK